MLEDQLRGASTINSYKCIRLKVGSIILFLVPHSVFERCYIVIVTCYCVQKHEWILVYEIIVIFSQLKSTLILLNETLDLQAWILVLASSSLNNIQAPLRVQKNCSTHDCDHIHIENSTQTQIRLVMRHLQVQMLIHMSQVTLKSKRGLYLT